MTAPDRFRGYLLALDDASFFAIVRNYLGPVQTPYHKPDIVSRLIEFVRDAETQRRMAAALADGERRVAATIGWMGCTPTATLARVLGDDMPPDEVRTILMTLRDRLLIIECSAGVALNPLVDGAVLGVTDAVLVAGRPAPSTASGAPVWWNVQTAVALASLIRSVPAIYTRGRAVRRGARERLRGAFGELFAGTAGEHRLGLAIGALLELELLRDTGSELVVVEEGWDELVSAPVALQHTLLVAAAVVGGIDGAFEMAEIVRRVFTTLPADRLFTPGEVRRALMLTGNGASLSLVDSAVRDLVSLGLLLDVAGADGDQPYVQPNGEASTLYASHVTEGAPRVDATMGVTIVPDVPPREHLAVSRFGELEAMDRVAHYRLTDASVSAAVRRQDETGDSIVRRLGGTVPQYVRFQIERWAARANAVRMFDQPTVVADAATSEILAVAEDFQTMVALSPAPGVYILHPGAARQASALLERMGLSAGEPLAPAHAVSPGRLRSAIDARMQPALADLRVPGSQPAAASPTRGSGDSVPRAVDQPIARPADRRFGGDASRPAAPVADAASTPIDPRRDLRALLDDAILPETARRELRRRIDLGIILFPEQLRGDLAPEGPTEARTLDYMGKVRLAEAAIRSGDLLELTTRAADGTPTTTLIRPERLDTGGADLTVRGMTLVDEREVRIAIRRVALMRRLTGNLIRRPLPR